MPPIGGDGSLSACAVRVSGLLSVDMLIQFREPYERPESAVANATSKPIPENFPALKGRATFMPPLRGGGTAAREFLSWRATGESETHRTAGGRAATIGSGM